MRTAILTLGFVLTAGSSRAQEGVCTMPGAPPLLRFVWSDHGGAVADLQPHVARELANLLAPLDLGASWTVWDGRERRWLSPRRSW